MPSSIQRPTPSIPAPATEPSPPATEPVIDLRAHAHSEQVLADVRHHRSTVKIAMAELADALARPAEPDESAWLLTVALHVQRLRTAFSQHVAVHEAPDSFLSDVQHTCPHLIPHVARLQRDHRRLEAALDSLAHVIATDAEGSVADVRALSGDILDQLARHRRRGAQVVWDAFNYDLGGEH